MIRLGLALILATGVFAAEAPPYAIKLVSFPATDGSHVSRLTRSDAGAIWAAWTAPEAGGTALYFSTLTASVPDWSAPHSIARSVLPLDGSPSLAVSGKNAVIAWSAGERVYVNVSHNGGKSWKPLGLAKGTAGHFPVVGALADGGFVLAWLEKSPSEKLPALAKLNAALITPAGKVGEATTVATNACDCCAISFSAFADGGAIVMYRSLSEEQNRDPYFSRLHQGSWSAAQTTTNDGWLSLTCPASGPRVTTDGGRVAAIWYTAADNDGRLLTSGSPDAGDRFLLPLRVEDGASDGVPDIALLHDGASLAFWAEDTTGKSQRSIWLRRLTPDYTLQPRVKIADADAHQTVRELSVAVVADYAGGTADASLVFITTWNDNSKPASYLVTVPESQLLAAADPGCHCAPAPAELVGFPFRGRVLSLTKDTATLQHAEIAGVMDEGSTVYRADPSDLSQLSEGTSVLGRMERRNGVWWLYAVRTLAASPKK